MTQNSAPEPQSSSILSSLQFDFTWAMSTKDSDIDLMTDAIPLRCVTLPSVSRALIMHLISILICVFLSPQLETLDITLVCGREVDDAASGELSQPVPFPPGQQLLFLQSLTLPSKEVETPYVIYENMITSRLLSRYVLLSNPSQIAYLQSMI